MLDVTSLAIGAAGVGGLYFAYLCATKGVPYAWGLVKTWWSSTATRLTALEADVAKIKTKVGV